MLRCRISPASGRFTQRKEEATVVTSTHVLLGLVVLSTGLFSGLLMTVKFFERALRDLSGPEFAVVMQRFLKVTHTHPLNYAMVLTTGFAPIALLVMTGCWLPCTAWPPSPCWPQQD